MMVFAAYKEIKFLKIPNAYMVVAVYDEDFFTVAQFSVTLVVVAAAPNSFFGSRSLQIVSPTGTDS